MTPRVIYNQQNLNDPKMMIVRLLTFSGVVGVGGGDKVDVHGGGDHPAVLDQRQIEAEDVRVHEAVGDQVQEAGEGVLVLDLTRGEHLFGEGRRRVRPCLLGRKRRSIR